MKKISRKEAEIILYELWQHSRIPADFTNEHESYDDAIKLCMEKGTLTPSDVKQFYNRKEEEGSLG